MSAAAAWTVSEKPGRYYRRFSVSQRLQHGLLMLCVFTLIITGLPVRFHEVGTAELMVRWMGGNAMRGLLHRGAALALLALTVYHIFFVLFSRRGREEFLALLPKREDVGDLRAWLRWQLGFSKQRPEFGRFTPIEKFEYLAVGWGVVVMGLTGLMLWFPTQTMVLLPKWMLDVARIMHSYEALLAFLSIVIWHFYNVHLSPAVFPMSNTWIDGLISEERMLDEHGREYQRVRHLEEEWVVVTPGLAPAPALEAVLPVVEARSTSVVAAAWGGSLVGAGALLVVSPLLALAAWLLNPEESGWSVALMLVSVIILPSAAAGAVISAGRALAGRRSSEAVLTGFWSLLGFYLGALSLWIPLGALVYVVGWFVPTSKLTGTVGAIVLALSLLLGLLGGLWGASKGRAWARLRGGLKSRSQ